MVRVSNAKPPSLHRAIGTATACGRRLDSVFDRTWRHPRLPEHARSYWNGQHVIWVTVMVEDVTCAKCKAMPK
jgi:hypothetical protein